MSKLFIFCDYGIGLTGSMRDVLSAATRLNLIGTLGAALLQHQVAPIAEVILEKWMNRDVEEACQTMPLLDTV